MQLFLLNKLRTSENLDIIHFHISYLSKAPLGEKIWIRDEKKCSQIYSQHIKNRKLLKIVRKQIHK